MSMVVHKTIIASLMLLSLFLGHAQASYGSGNSLITAWWDDETLGQVTPASFNEEVGPTNTDTGAYDSMTYAADSRGYGRVVRTFLKAKAWLGGSIKTGDGNVLVISLADRTQDSACMSYDVRFSPNFNFSWGGKLPGLMGVAPGHSPSEPAGGGSTEHGWGGRLMWVGPGTFKFVRDFGKNNMVVTYLYHYGQTGEYGDNVQWRQYFVAGKWHHVQQCYTMNTASPTMLADGKLQAWFDGVQVLNLNNVIYRKDPNVHITHFDWSIFRGGWGDSWASSTDGYVDVDNLLVTKLRQSTSSVGNGLWGQYYTGSSFASLVASRADPTINFNWGAGGPGITSSFPKDNYSVKWTGYVKPRCTGTYTFSTVSDDGVRLSVNSVQLINDWIPHSATTNSGSIALNANVKYLIKLEYMELTGNSRISLSWSQGTCETAAIIPQAYLFSS